MFRSILATFRDLIGLARDLWGSKSKAEKPPTEEVNPETARSGTAAGAAAHAAGHAVEKATHDE